MDKKKIISLAVLLFLVIALPLGLLLVESKRNLSVQKKAAGNGTLNAVFSTASTSVARGASFDVTIQLTNSTATTVQARVGTAVIKYNPAIFEIVGVTGENDNPCAGGVFPNKAVGELQGTDKFEITCFKAAGSASADFPAATLKQLAKFTLKVKDTATLGSTNLEFDHIKVPKANQSNIDLSGTTTPTSFTITGGGATGTPTQGLTGTASPTVTQVPGNGVINFNLKIRDMIARPNSYYTGKTTTFKVTLDKGGVRQTFTPTVTIGNDTIAVDGTWLVRITGFTKVAGTYDVYIKGPRELQKKFPNVVLTAENSQDVDLSDLGVKYLLESGDLPVGTNGAQNGVVNVSDASYLANCLGLDTTACLTTSDLNYDGSVTTIDINMMNNTIYSRWEDEVAE